MSGRDQEISNTPDTLSKSVKIGQKAVTQRLRTRRCSRLDFLATQIIAHELVNTRVLNGKTLPIQAVLAFAQIKLLADTDGNRMPRIGIASPSVSSAVLLGEHVAQPGRGQPAVPPVKGAT